MPPAPDAQIPATQAHRRVTVGFAALIVVTVAFALLAGELSSQGAIDLDASVTSFLHALASPLIDQLMGAITLLGSNTTIEPVLIVAVASLIWVRRPRLALYVTLAVTGSLVINEALKQWFERPRPQLAWAPALSDFSFPSGHTMNSLVCFVSLAAVIWAIRGRRSGIVALLGAICIATLVGTSRIYLGVHYFSDVVGALLAGSAWLLIVGAAFQVGFLLRLRHAPLDQGKSIAL